MVKDEFGVWQGGDQFVNELLREFTGVAIVAVLIIAVSIIVAVILLKRRKKRRASRADAGTPDGNCAEGAEPDADTPILTEFVVERDITYVHGESLPEQ
jgi:hypothetical protein